MSNSIYRGRYSLEQLNDELRGNSAVFKDVTLSEISRFNASGSSFRLDPPGTGLKSTQQLPLDWSKFENHTFFNSAQAKTNVAFETIFNNFPFDDTRPEIEAFLDSLTGFERYVYDLIPKHTGYINFDGTNHINVIDRAGVEIPEMSKDQTGISKIDPEMSSMSLEMQLFVPEIVNSNQVLLQKLSNQDMGFTLALSASSSTSNCNLVFIVSSGSQYMESSAQVNKGEFFSVSAQINRSPGVDRLYIYVDGTLSATSSNSTYIGQMNFKSSPLNIATGSIHSPEPAYSFAPAAKFSGSIDDLRIYHKVRTASEISSSLRNTVFPSADLKLLYRFNEPSGSYSNSSTVIDHSGNGLHSSITNFTGSQRIAHVVSPLTYEKIKFSPILFPDHPEIVELNATLLASASQYDLNNPNLITKLIPQHYLTREQDFYVLDSIEGNVGQGIDVGNEIPRDTRLGSTQLISSLLYVWAKHFDETKCFLDHFSKLRTTAYSDFGTVSDQMLPYLANYYDVSLPNMFRGVSTSRYALGESDRDDAFDLSLTFQSVQNTVWRRVLTEFPNVIKSKGTLNAIKGFIRSVGVEPDSIVKFKEYGGTKSGYILPNRSNRSVVQGMLNFSGSLFEGAVTYDPNSGVPDSLPFVSSTYLSASRAEPGLPTRSNTSGDGLFTSGSWSYEAIYKFEPRIDHPVTQSLARLHVTGTSSPSSRQGVFANLIATSRTSSATLDLYVATSDSPASNPYLQLTLNNSQIFDGSSWHVSFGRDVTENEPSSSYYLWATRQNPGVSDYQITSGSHLDEGSVVDTITSYNTSGAFLCIGPQALFEGSSVMLNDPSTPDAARESMFSGKVGRIRFWTKKLTVNELLEHARNVESVGVENPTLNYNFVTRMSGSWERLRLDASCTQETTSSDSGGRLQVFDYSQNNFHLSGSGFGAVAQAIQKERTDSSVVSMQFDEAQTNNKVRIRSFLDSDQAELEGVAVAPLYDMATSETPEDDLRFSVEVSATRVLDEDIAKIFATLDEIDDAIGSPELQFSPDYPRLEVLRDIYFNRLTEKIKMKQLYEFFRWFDSALGSMIEKMVPGNTQFVGSNYVIAPHSLERSKFYYLQSGVYLGENERSGARGTIRLGQVTARVRKF